MRSACFFLGADVAPAEEPLGRWTDTEDKEEETESARGLLELEPEAKEEFFVAIFRLKQRKATSRKRELVVESLGGKQENGKCKHPANYQGNPHKPAQKVKETNLKGSSLESQTQKGTRPENTEEDERFGKERMR